MGKEEKDHGQMPEDKRVRRCKSKYKTDENLLACYLAGKPLYVYRGKGDCCSTQPMQLNIKIGHYFLSKEQLGQTLYIMGQTMDGLTGQLKSSYLKQVFDDEDQKHFEQTILAYRSNTKSALSPNQQQQITASSELRRSLTGSVAHTASRNTKTDNSDLIHSFPLKRVPCTEEYVAITNTLAKEGRGLSLVGSDGNCLFRALSTCLFGNETKHKLLRRSIVVFMRDNAAKFSYLVDQGKIEKHIDDMTLIGTWATTAELFAASTMLQREIFVFVELNAQYQWILIKPVFIHEKVFVTFDTAKLCRYITICNTARIHFDIIVPLIGCNCFCPKPVLNDNNLKTEDKPLEMISEETTLCENDLTETHSSSEFIEIQTEMARKRPRLQEVDECHIPKNMKDNIEEKFSQSLFQELLACKRSLHTSKCTQETLREEIGTLNTRAEQAEGKLVAAEKKMAQHKISMEKLYRSLICCSCTQHFDTIDREPNVINCKHIVCSQCLQESTKKAKYCRLCGARIEEERTFSAEVFLLAIKSIETEIMK